MSEQTKEAMALTIRELGRQNDELRRKYESLLKRPKSERVTTACLGFGLVQVAQNGHGIATAAPQIVFKPERFCVSAECAGHFVIADLKVGMRSQFIDPRPIPARLFAVENVHKLREIDCEDDFDAALPMSYDTILPGMLMTIVVNRIDDSSIPFECVMTGLTLDEDPAKIWPLGPVTRTYS